MAAIAILPVIVSIFLHLFFKSKALQDISKLKKSLIAGIIFGILAIFGTEKGIPYNGAVVNARDAAPLCAALIFGGEAGILAGLIGGVERWLSVYWGVGAYTRVACSVSTIVTGIVGALLRKYMFDDKIPAWHHAFAVGLLCETFHMMMVFVTNMSDVVKAFSVVKTCAVPMVLVNSLAAAFAVFVISKLEKDSTYDNSEKQRTLSQTFQKGILKVVIIALIVTETFTFIIQYNISRNDTKSIIALNIDDIENSISLASDENLLEKSRRIVLKISDDYSNMTTNNLLDICKEYDVAEINVVNKSGYIVSSSNVDFIGYDMSSGSQSIEFLQLNGDKIEVVQPYQIISYDRSTYRKYAGVKTSYGFIQVGLDAVHFQSDLEYEIEGSATNRHIGQAGGLIIANEKGEVITDTNNSSDISLKSLGIDNLDKIEDNKIYKANLYGEDCYYMHSITEGYSIIGYVPVKDVDFSMELSIYLNFFLETLVFGSLFIFIYFITKYNIVDNVLKITKSLKKITDGDLNEQVNVYTNQEFTSLSNGINATVASMNSLIDEANNRMKAELQYAKDIQHSALPSIFPPFPDRDEFDIYALMRPAKEVGGDFYDFYFINNDVLSIVVADVSGKGIPAALFMMRSKSILKSYAEAGIAVADIFTNANYSLCEGNDTGMFVTAWMGFVNLKTGQVKFANAGHNPPVIKRKDGTYEYLKSKAGFVLAGMDGIAYKEQETVLEPGDEIFIYTDGVVEATNANTILFGEDRLKESLDKYCQEDAENMCKAVLEDVDQFVGEAPQFDDITMLSLKLKEKK